VALGISLGLAFSSPSQADEPLALGWKLVEFSKEVTMSPGATPGGDTQVLAGLFATEELARSSLLLVFPGCDEDPQTDGKPVLNLNQIIARKDTRPKYNEKWQDPGPAWRVCPDQRVVLIEPGTSPGNSIQFMLRVDFLRFIAREAVSPKLRGHVYPLSEADLKFAETTEQLEMLVKNRQPASQLIVDLYYRMGRGDNQVSFGSYEDIYGKALAGRAGKKTLDYKKVINMMPVNVESFRRDLRLPGLFKDDGGKLFERTLKQILAKGSGNEGDKICYPEDEKNAGKAGMEKAPPGFSHTISGIFSTKWSSDHALHSGFGFRVEAWTDETGSWKFLASDWVQANGSWTLNVPNSKGFLGNRLSVYYRSYNDYYAPQNQSGGKYSWVDPLWTSIPANFSTGHRYADTDGGSYNGVGELVDAAMTMWSRLYWDGGINPVPSSALKLYFPNTWENCGGSSPWSCANTSGEIWLIAAHGTQADVVVHEMSHQLNNKFWGNKRPAGSGGSHTLDGCYSSRLGMALREGFADFMPAWVGYPNRNTTDGGFSSGRWALGLDPESRFSPPNCTNGWENETWVAHTFWDLHDTRSDGDDILWFIHKGAVPALYLSNGIANDGDARDMRDYENTYRNAASAGHQGYISDIFNQNRM
jgi:hypothetical protein